MSLALAVGMALGTQGSPGTFTVAPAYGVDTGGTAVTLTGSGFVSGAAVTFAGIAATSVVVVSATQITCLAPTGTGGNVVDVVVTDPDGESATAASAFTYYSLPSTVSGVKGWWADTFTLSGSNITQWTDLSGSAHHMPGQAGALPTKTAAGCNGHDVATFTPGTESTHALPQYFRTTGFLTSALISNSAYYMYSLVNIVDIKTDSAGNAAFANEAIFADDSGVCEQPLKKTGTLVLAANFGGNVDPTNGETISTPIATGAWQIVTTRHTAGKIGVRVGTGSTFTETTSGNTDLSFNGRPMFGANWSRNRGIHGQVAVAAVFNRALTSQEDAAVLAYLRNYGGI